MRLLLIRHGETPGNVLGQLDTAHPGPGLTDVGMRQARLLLTTLADVSVDAVFASTLIRTRLTAAPLAEARHLPVQIRDGLHEIEAGDLELRSDHESILRYRHTLYRWGLGDLSAAMPGGPDGHSFFDRFDADITEISGSGAHTAVVFSHGAAIRAWVSNRAKNITPIFGAENQLHNTEVVILEGSSVEGWNLRAWAGKLVSASLDS
ncbi:MAG: histidine phosphatase family protein [Terrimesophilobacter sp.]